MRRRSMVLRFVSIADTPMVNRGTQAYTNLDYLYEYTYAYRIYRASKTVARYRLVVAKRRSTFLCRYTYLCIS